MRTRSVDAMQFIVALIADGALMWAQTAIDDVDDRRLAGAIVTDKTDTFTGKNCKIGAIKRLAGTKMHLNAAGRDDRLPLGILSHRSIVFDCNHGSSGRA